MLACSCNVCTSQGISDVNNNTYRYGEWIRIRLGCAKLIGLGNLAEPLLTCGSGIATQIESAEIA